MLRKEGNVYVLDLFVRVLVGANTPIKYSSWRLMRFIKSGLTVSREKRVTSACSEPGFPRRAPSDRIP